VKAPEELSELFRANGRKVTAQRQCIFRALQGSSDHPSADSIHRQVSREMDTVSLKTVYQTLHDLTDLGEIAALDVGTGLTLFDPNVEQAHHHLVCRRCGTVRDLTAPLPEIRLPDGAALGYDVGSAEIVFRGLCPDCRVSDPAHPASPLSDVPPVGPA